MNRMKQILLFAVFASLAMQAHALRCNHRVVNVGDYDFEVARRCGEPDYVHSRIAYPYRLVSLRALRPVIDYLPYPIVVDEWVYNFGTHRLLYLLEFENGRLVHIRTRRRGY